MVNIASGEVLKLKDLVIAVGDHLDQRKLIKFINIPSASGEPQQMIAGVSRMRFELGYKPQFDIERGLSVTHDHLKASFRAI